MPSKAQGAIELLVLLALIAVAGLVIYSSSQTNLSQSKRALITSQARAAVNDLATAASQVYSEGFGAKRMVYITIPEGTISSRVYANNSIINIGVSIDSTITDINTQTTMKVVQGADFPTTPGSYWVPVTARAGYVLIGNSYLSINPSSLSIEMSPSSSTNSTIVFTNVGSTPINVTLTRQWSYDGIVNLTLNTTNFVLTPGAGATAYVQANLITFLGTPLQLYSGNIGVSTNTSEAANIGLSVNVVGTQIPTGASYLAIETFKDNSYSTLTTNFTLPKNVTLTGLGWNGSSTVDINVRDPSGRLVLNFSCPTNSSGAFNCSFIPAGLTPGQYSITANQSMNQTAYSNITACS